MKHLAALLLLSACAEPTTDVTVTPIDCSTLGLDVPSARGEVAGIWDAPRARFLTFGGNEAVPENCAPGSTQFIQDTWAFYPACGAYQELTGEGPRKRGRYAIAHDVAGQRLILHGGRLRNADSGDYILLDDTWVLDLTTDTWSQWTIDGPGARFNHSGAMVDGRFVLFGGSTDVRSSQFEPKRDTWALDLTTRTWSKVEAGNKPEARLYHAATTDGTSLYVYGGGDEGAFLGDFFGDLWALDVAAGRWKRLDAGGPDSPPQRIWANLVHDPTANRLLLFAGHDETDLGNLNDLWSFDLGTKAWTQLSAGDTYLEPELGTCDFPPDFALVDLDTPERREAAAAVWADDRMLVFGGKSDCGNLNDVWTWDPTTEAWEEQFRATTGEVCRRTSATCSSLCF